MKTLFYVLCLASILQAPSTLMADEKRPADVRRHFQVIGPSDDILYEATEIVRLSDDTDAMFMLIRDTGHGDFVMRRIWTFENQAVVTRISDLKDRTFVQTTATMPFQSKTRLETLAEARRNPRHTDVPVVFKMETNGGRWDAVETDLQETTVLRRIRHDLRQTIDFFLLEAIERMRGSFLGVAEGEVYFPMLARYAIYDVDSEDTEKAGIKTRDAMPNCSFDQSFGFPCSEKQKERADKAIKSGKPVPRY
jgi:hypothetical protein